MSDDKQSYVNSALSTATLSLPEMLISQAINNVDSLVDFYLPHGAQSDPNPIFHAAFFLWMSKELSSKPEMQRFDSASRLCVASMRQSAEDWKQAGPNGDRNVRVERLYTDMIRYFASFNLEMALKHDDGLITPGQRIDLDVERRMNPDDLLDTLVEVDYKDIDGNSCPTYFAGAHTDALNVELGKIVEKTGFNYPIKDLLAVLREAETRAEFEGSRLPEKNLSMLFKLHFASSIKQMDTELAEIYSMIAKLQCRADIDACRRASASFVRRVLDFGVYIEGRHMQNFFKVLTEEYLQFSIYAQFFPPSMAPPPQ
jgi:hypothetical protein